MEILRPLIFGSRIGEGGTCELFCIQPIVTFLRVVHSFRKSVREAFSCEVVAKANLVLEVLEG
jgi:hypothetical protein